MGSFLLAAGCAADYESFVEEYGQLSCEISLACGHVASCEGPQSTHFPATIDDIPECERYRPAQAVKCLRELEESLERVEADEGACFEELRGKPSCSDAVDRRDTPKCELTSISGRPLRHDGAPLLAEVITGDAWAEHAHALGCEDAAARTAAEHWLAVARTEHASVAAFARVALELMAMGAPPHLLEGCHRAALDEIQHARLALDLARALGNPAWDLGAIPAVPARAPTLHEIAVDALLEGCIGEGGAAAAAHWAADRAAGPVAVALRRIAVDETRHAALAWATLRWALEQDRRLAGPLRAALARALAERGAQRSTAAADRPELLALGVTSTDTLERIELEVIERIVEPVLAALLRDLGATTTAYA